MSTPEKRTSKATEAAALAARQRRHMKMAVELGDAGWHVARPVEQFTPTEGPDMDPDKCLDEIREMMELLDSGWLSDPDNQDRLVEKWRALDEWMAKGGYRPGNWRDQ